MGIKVGNVDLVSSAVDSEARIMILERLVQRLVDRLESQAIFAMSQEDYDKIEKEVFEIMNKKYPELGIKRPAK